MTLAISGVALGESDDYILIGSHMDSVSNGGKYDEFYGVIAGLEILRSVKDLNITTNYTISLIDFTNEEGARPSLLGSGLTSGVFEKEYVYSRRDKDNITVVNRSIRTMMYSIALVLWKRRLIPEFVA
jgi:N-carbamoyl-L-amino-acid hydrolase